LRVFLCIILKVPWRECNLETNLLNGLDGLKMDLRGDRGGGFPEGWFSGELLVVSWDDDVSIG
jgi:hypothetical protein